MTQERIRELTKTMLRKKLYVVLSKGGAAPEKIAEHLPRHLEYMIGLEKKGVLQSLSFNGKQATTEDHMSRVKKIAHAVYEMPDVDKQSEYYTEVIGLAPTDKSKDAVYLASTIDHHSVVLRKGSQAKCVRLGFQIGPDDDLGAFEKQIQGHGIK